MNFRFQLFMHSIVLRMLPGGLKRMLLNQTELIKTFSNKTAAFENRVVMLFEHR